jgi:hypothetical protein
MLSRLGKLIALGELKERISTYLDSDFTDEEKELLKLANASFKRIDEGKVEDPYQIIHDDNT